MKGKRYYLAYIENYLPRLKSRYLYGIMRCEDEIKDRVVDEVLNNRFLEQKEKEYVLREILKEEYHGNNIQETKRNKTL